MPRMEVAKRFKFSYADGRQEIFEPGVYNDVPEEVATHWFAKAHFVGADDRLPPIGTPEYADLARRKATALMEEARQAQMKADAAAEQQRAADEAVRQAMEQARQNNTAPPRFEPNPRPVVAGTSAPVTRTPDSMLGAERTGPQALLTMEAYETQKRADAMQLEAEAMERDQVRAHLLISEAHAEAAMKQPQPMPDAPLGTGTALLPPPEPEASQGRPKPVDSGAEQPEPVDRPDRPKPVV